jgi:hypothetical protein
MATLRVTAMMRSGSQNSFSSVMVVLSLPTRTWRISGVKSLSTAFLADLEEDWRAHGKKVFPVLREKYSFPNRAGK